MPLFRLPRAVLGVLLLMGGMRSSHALQLGETEAQILARHGAPGEADHGRHVAIYSWAGWSVRLDFQGGKVAKLTYKKTDDFGPDDFGSLLQANGGIAHWRETSQAGAKTRQWARDDGALATFETILKTSMTIQSAESAAPVKVAALPEPVKAAPALEFFPDPQAAIAKSDSKLSEISVPNKPTAPEIRAAKAEEPQVASSNTTAAKAANGVSTAPVSEPTPAERQSLADIAPPAVQKKASETSPSQFSGSDSSIGRLLAVGCIGFGISGALLLLYKSLPPRTAPDAPSPRYARPPSRRAGAREICADEFELITGDVPVNGKRCSVK